MSAEKSKTDGKFNKYISAALVVVIIFAIGVLAYTSLVEKEPKKSDNDQPLVEEPEKSIFTISVDSASYNYTLNELMTFDSVSEQGSYINKIGKITGPNNYTGVSVIALLSSIEGLPDNYTVHAIASDGYALNYSRDEVNGSVSIFNETGNETGIGDFTMIVAYEENGVVLNETTSGPLRIAFVDDEGSISSSGLWLQSLVKVEII